MRMDVIQELVKHLSIFMSMQKSDTTNNAEFKAKNDGMIHRVCPACRLSLSFWPLQRWAAQQHLLQKSWSTRDPPCGERWAVGALSEQ